MDKEQAMQMVKDLATKLGVTIEHLWGVLVYQQQITALIDALNALVGIGVLLLIIHYARKWHKQYTKEITFIEDARQKSSYPYRLHEDLINAKGTLWMIRGIGVGACMLTATITINYLFAAISEWLNPEYHALQVLLQMVKGG